MSIDINREESMQHSHTRSRFERARKNYEQILLQAGNVLTSEDNEELIDAKTLSQTYDPAFAYYDSSEYKGNDNTSSYYNPSSSTTAFNRSYSQPNNTFVPSKSYVSPTKTTKPFNVTTANKLVSQSIGKLHQESMSYEYPRDSFHDQTMSEKEKDEIILLLQEENKQLKDSLENILQQTQSILQEAQTTNEEMIENYEQRINSLEEYNSQLQEECQALSERVQDNQIVIDAERNHLFRAAEIFGRFKERSMKFQDLRSKSIHILKDPNRIYYLTGQVPPPSQPIQPPSVSEEQSSHVLTKPSTSTSSSLAKIFNSSTTSTMKTNQQPPPPPPPPRTNKPQDNNNNNNTINNKNNNNNNNNNMNQLSETNTTTTNRFKLLAQTQRDQRDQQRFFSQSKR